MATAEEGTWRTRLGARVAVVLTLVVAVLSVVTGVANITTTTVFGPFAAAIPPSIQRLAGFTGTLTGFLMLAGALGLRRGLRIAWYLTAVLLPVTALQGVIQVSEYSVPLIVVSVLSMPVVWLNRAQFDRELSLSTTQLAAGSALIGIQAYGTVGSYALRDEFGGISTPLDALWFTIVTSSTVGYGDATPTTQVAKLFGISVLVLGTASFAIALTALLGPAIEARFSRVLGRMTESELELLQNHVLVLGYGDLTEPILTELDEGDVEFVVVVRDPATANELSDRGFKVITADPSDDDPLIRAKIGDAKAIVVATNNDAEDALAVLTARELRPDARIVAAATDDENAGKLRRAGADTVISPATIGGHLLVQSALGAEDSEALADAILSTSSTRGGEGGEGGARPTAREVLGDLDEGTDAGGE